jgi:predicted nucleic acid-binding protein
VKISAALAKVSRIYIEAAPLIYYVEQNLAYVDRMDAIIDEIDKRPIQAFSSAIILSEVLRHPLKLGKTQLVHDYEAILLHSGNFRLLPIRVSTVRSAADLRARYNLRTPDALHVASAIESGCDAFLTNHAVIKRVTELKVLLLDDLWLDPRT